MKFCHFLENIQKKDDKDDKFKIGDEIYTISKKTIRDKDIGPTYTQYTILELIEEQKTYTKAKTKIFSQVYVHNDIFYVYGIEDTIFYFHNEKNNDIRNIKKENSDYIILNNKKYDKYILNDEDGYLLYTHPNPNNSKKGCISWLFYTLYLFLFFFVFLLLPYSNYSYSHNTKRFM